MKTKFLVLTFISLLPSCRDSAESGTKNEAQEPAPQTTGEPKESGPNKKSPLIIPQIVSYGGLIDDEDALVNHDEDIVIKLTSTESAASLVEKIEAIPTPQTVGMFAVIAANTLEDTSLIEAMAAAAGKHQNGTLLFSIESADNPVSVTMTMTDSRIADLKAK